MREVILVNPEKPENTGFIARLSANFDYNIKIVNPDFNLESSRKTAKKAQNKLREAKIYQSLEKAIDNNRKTIATKMNRGEKLNEIEKTGEISLVIGRESSGLTNAEIDMCDETAHIETSKYGSLNQSHAAAIVMHYFFSG